MVSKVRRKRKPTIPKFLGAELPAEIRQNILIRTHTIPTPNPGLTNILGRMQARGSELLNLEIRAYLANSALMRKIEIEKIMMWADNLKIAFPEFGDDVDYVEEQLQKELNILYDEQEAALIAGIVVGNEAKV